LFSKSESGSGIANRKVTMITVYELSYMLDVDEKTLRRWLREDYPKRAPGKGNRWEITTQMARRMVRRANQ